MKKNKNSLAALLVTQGSFKFYVVAMPSDMLRHTCFTVNREEDPIEGFQRRLDESRATEIAQYIDTGVGSIPTAIVLSAQAEATLSYNSRSKTISFEPTNKSFLIIDGQHRVYGFIKATNLIRIPVVIYEGLTRVEEARLFIDINTNQKQVPEALLLDVKRLLQDESAEEKRCSDLFEKFYNDPASVLKGYLSRTERTSGKISRITFNNSMKELLDLGFIKELNNDKVFSAINSYLRAYQKVFTEMDSSLNKAIIKSTVFQAALNTQVYRHVVDKTLSLHNRLNPDTFYEVLKQLKSNLSAQKIIRPGNSHKRLSENILEALTNVSIQPGIIIED